MTKNFLHLRRWQDSLHKLDLHDLWHTQSEIDKAYRALAKKFHSDKTSNEDDRVAWLEIVEAHEFLDARKNKSSYDLAFQQMKDCAATRGFVTESEEVLGKIALALAVDHSSEYSC